MTATLHRDPGDGEHLDALPAWIAPKGGGRYWHQPRSAHIYKGRLVVQFWCGQQDPNVADHRLRDDPPDDLRCGTCIGRRAGYDRTEGAVFRPRDHWKPPARCPGNDWQPPEHKVCRACGAKVQAARGTNAWGSAGHRPGPDLADRLTPCPQHGWSRIYQAGEVFTCGAWQCEWRTG